MIGIVGFGRFGKLMVRYLVPDFEVAVYDPVEANSDIEKSGARPVSLESVCRQKIVVLAVPISELRAVLRTIAPMLSESALVVDVCSVKELPIRWMRELLPQSVAILATHPMFGPDSAAQSLSGCKIVLCKERIDDRSFGKIKSYLCGRGLVVIEATAEEHDRQISISLALTHFIGRSLARFGARPLEVDTEGYKRLIHILGVVEHDTWQLFVDMHRYNPYAAENRKAFMAAMDEINEFLNE
jgi:prephenate dehydrogenase